NSISGSVYPNPAVRNMAVSYNVPDKLDHLEITIWNVQGKMVFNLFHGAESAGTHNRTWNGRDHENRDLPAGTYIMRFRTGVRHFETKFSIVK
ncbi:MAG: T9SS type A sorting domain-containing protein, partial [Fibrobacteres bacterium]|nr:T9SS type A sorting domain-containing protein [Fibrobacterota bacterium]